MPFRRTSLSFDSKLFEVIKKIAIEEKRSFGKQVNRIVEDWLEWKKK